MLVLFTQILCKRDLILVRCLCVSATGHLLHNSDMQKQHKTTNYKHPTPFTNNIANISSKGLQLVRQLIEFFWKTKDTFTFWRWFDYYTADVVWHFINSLPLRFRCWISFVQSCHSCLDKAIRILGTTYIIHGWNRANGYWIKKKKGCMTYLSISLRPAVRETSPERQ